MGKIWHPQRNEAGMSSLAAGALSGRLQQARHLSASVTLFKLAVRGPPAGRRGRAWNPAAGLQTLWEKERHCCWQVCLAPEIDPVPPLVRAAANESGNFVIIK